MEFLGGLIGAGASLLGSVFSAKKQKETNAANIQQAENQMAFQERMSSTAHQREVEDLRKAGLNPILSANHGASTPGGAMATLENPYQSLSSDIATSAKTYMEMKLNRANLEAINSQVRLNDANAAKAVAEAGGYLGHPMFGRIPVSSALDLASKLWSKVTKPGSPSLKMAFSGKS